MNGEYEDHSIQSTPVAEQTGQGRQLTPSPMSNPLPIQNTLPPGYYSLLLSECTHFPVCLQEPKYYHRILPTPHPLHLPLKRSASMPLPLRNSDPQCIQTRNIRLVDFYTPNKTYRYLLQASTLFFPRKQLNILKFMFIKIHICLQKTERSGEPIRNAPVE